MSTPIFGSAHLPLLEAGAEPPSTRYCNSWGSIVKQTQQRFYKSISIARIVPSEFTVNGKKGLNSSVTVN